MDNDLVAIRKRLDAIHQHIVVIALPFWIALAFTTGIAVMGVLAVIAGALTAALRGGV